MATEECRQCEFYHNIKQTLDELDKRVRFIKPSPGDVPKVKGIDIYGESMFKQGSWMGGDHIIYIDFNKRYDLDARIERIEEKFREEMKDFPLEEQQTNRYIIKKRQEKDNIIASINENRTRAGILVADVKGHDESGSFIVGMLHQSFLTGALYEMRVYGKITTKLFEKINTRFYNSSSLDDFFTMIYGEISEDGKFLFITAGHPDPLVFSHKTEQFMQIPVDKIVRYTPIGVMPSGKDIDATLNRSILGYKQAYEINKIDLMDEGDILVLYTDGLLDLENDKGETFFPHHLQEFLKKHKSLSSREIATALKITIYEFCASPDDDITYVIIKKQTASIPG